MKPVELNKLNLEAYKLAEEVRDGKWNHIGGMKAKLLNKHEITDELARRCPGYTLEEYQRAFANGMFVSR